jgi:hypothetical protein
MKRIYLAGAITGTQKVYHSSWREFALEKLSSKYDVLNPLDQAAYDGSNGPSIVLNDEKMVTSADALLVLGERPSWGTGMEVQLAHMMHIPIFVVVRGNLETLDISPWLINRATIFFDDMNKAINYLLEWDP